MDNERNQRTERILHLTLEIIYLLTGENYTVVKKISDDHVNTSSLPRVSGGWSGTQSPITVPPPHSLIHERNTEQKILELTNKITQLLTGEVPIRCQDVTVYFSMEEWEYIEGHKDQYKEVMMENHQPFRCQKMEKDRNEVTECIVNIALEIIHLKSGEDYIVLKTSDEHVTPSCCPHVSGGWSRTHSPITVPPPHSLIHKRKNDQKILELTNKITQLLTGEVPIRYEDVAVYFSMEQWAYLEGHKDLYKKENDQTITSPECQPSCEKEECSTSDSEFFLEKKTHKKIKSYSCSECGKFFKLKASWIDHLRSHTGEKPFSCSECDKSFRSRNNCFRHCKIHSGAKPYSCAECGKCFRTPAALQSHSRTHSGEKPFSCSECGQLFTMRSSLTRHQRIHTEEKPYLCLECGQSFGGRTSLVTHMRLHTGRQLYICSECGKNYSCRADLLRHRTLHTGEKPFSCPECGKAFRLKNSMREHIRTHTGEKPYSCPQCGKLFKTKGDRLKHRKVHTGEKPYPCPHCGKSFRIKTALVFHIRTHTGEKPFPCSVCGKCFVSKAECNRHEAVHTKDKSLWCPECGRWFKQQSSLSLHLRVHSGEKINSCAYCGKCFTRESYLKKHEKLHQPDATFPDDKKQS